MRRIACVAVVGIALLFLSANFASALDALQPVPIGKPISDLYSYSLRIVGLAVFVMFVIAGLAAMVPWLQKKVGKPTEIILNAIIGLVILFSAYIILNSINPDLVTFQGAAPVQSSPVAPTPVPTFQSGGGGFGGGGASGDSGESW